MISMLIGRSYWFVALILPFGSTLLIPQSNGRGFCKDGEHLADTVIIIRTHKPMPGMLDRMKIDYNDVIENMPSTRLVISFDASNMHTGEAIEFLQQMRTEAPRALFHVYDWSTVVDIYPILKRLQWASGWNMHIEPLLNAVNYTRQHACIAQDANVWAIEDDVFFCGNMSTVLNSYRSDTSDLLFTKQLSQIREWFWKRKVSKQFKSMYSVHERVPVAEVIQRFSSDLLRRLHKLSVEGATAWSEMYASTVCASEGFKCSRLQEEHMGRTAWDFHASEAESHELCKNSTRPFMNHAAKFSAEGASELSSDGGLGELEEADAEGSEASGPWSFTPTRF